MGEGARFPQPARGKIGKIGPRKGVFIAIVSWLSILRRILGITKETVMKPMGPRRRFVSRGRRLPVEEVESEFPLSEDPSPKKGSTRGKIFLIGASIPFLIAVMYLGVLYLQGGKLFHGEVYPSPLFRQLVEGKTMEQVLAFLGPPTSLGADGDVNQWIYEPGPFDLSLYPYLPWKTPIMKGKIVRDPVGKKVPRRILIRFDNEKGVSPGAKGESRSSGKLPDPKAKITIEY